MKRIQLYIISLWLLFLLIAVKEFVFVSWRVDFSWLGIKNFVLPNISILVSVFFLLKARKINRTKFLDSLCEALIKKMDERDEK